MLIAEPTCQPVAVRAWTTQETERRTRRGGVWVDPGPSSWSLTFDTETTTDAGQSLRVGGYQLRQRDRLREEGIFYEPVGLSPTELEVVRAYCDHEGLALRTRDEFVDDVFLRTAWDRRGLIIGHNLPFDLSRISIANTS